MGDDITTAALLPCPDCRGEGRVRNDGGGSTGPLWVECERCKGTGKVVEGREE